MAAGRIVYLDEKANTQRAALASVANTVLLLANSSTIKRVGTRSAQITQQWTQDGVSVQIGDDAKFRALFIMGIDGLNPIVVKNNLSWDIPETVKEETQELVYRGEPNGFNESRTNS